MSQPAPQSGGSPEQGIEVDPWRRRLAREGPQKVALGQDPDEASVADDGQAADDLLMLFGSEMGHIASALANELGRSKL